MERKRDQDQKEGKMREIYKGKEGDMERERD